MKIQVKSYDEIADKWLRLADNARDFSETETKKSEKKRLLSIAAIYERCAAELRMIVIIK